MVKRKYNYIYHSPNTYSIGGFINGLAEGKGLGEFGKSFGAGTAAGGLLNAASGLVGGIAGNAISGGLQSGAGNFINGLSNVASAIPGPWGAIAGVGLKTVGGLANRAFGSKMNNENINTVNSRIDSMKNFTSDASSFDELSDIMSTTANATGFSNKYIGKDGWFSSKAKKKARALREQQDMAQGFVDSTLLNNLNNIQQDQLNNMEANYVAFGGPLFAYGGDFSNGIIQVDNGGTHEENSFGGVPMGISPEGTPNLVEEGETIFNDYVFSNRMVADKDIIKRYNLPQKYKGKTFADISKSMSKESKERPNDPISRRGLGESMAKLQSAQEEVRQGGINVEDNTEGKYAHGGRMGIVFEGPGDRSNFLQFYTPAERFTRNLQKQGIIPTYKFPALQKPFSMMSPREIQESVSNFKLEVPSLIDTRTPTEKWMEENVKPDKFTFSDTNSKKANITPSSNNFNTKGSKLTWLRYAPVLGAAIGIGQDLFSKPDYSSATAILDAANQAGNYTPVSFSPIGNYLRYNPFDRDYYINKLNAQSGATRRSIVNNGGPSRAAELLALDYNTQGRIGDLARQAEEYNLAQRERVGTFNRGTDQYNSEMGLRAAMANQSALASARNARLSGLAQAMAMRNDIDARRGASMSANFTNFFDSLGNIGIDAYNREDRDKLIRAGVFGTLSEKPQEWSNKDWDTYNGLINKALSGNSSKRRGGYLTIRR